jgi:hypothetical protein
MYDIYIPYKIHATSISLGDKNYIYILFIFLLWTDSVIKTVT